MYPDLSYVFHDLFGSDLDNWTSIFKTFGLLLVTAIFTAAYILYLELKRKAGEGLFEAQKVKMIKNKPFSRKEAIVNALWGFVLGFKIVYIIQHFAEFKQDAAGVLLSTKGHLAAGIIGAIAFALYPLIISLRKKGATPEVTSKEIYPHNRTGDIAVIAAISGVAGAKIFALLEDLPAFFNDPLHTFFSGSGLAIYGGLIGGFIGVFIYLRKKDIPYIHVMDAVAPALIVAYGVGRLGCHFAGDGDWGIVNAAAQPGWWFLPDWLWAYDYPRNVLNEGVVIKGATGYYNRQLAEAVFPTPVYEMIMAFLIGGILWFLRKRIRIAGMLFFIYLIFNGIERFWIEKIRVNIQYDYFGMKFTQAELIAVLFFVLGVVGCLFLWRRDKKRLVSD